MISCARDLTLVLIESRNDLAANQWEIQMRYIGCDKAGISRVWGESENSHEAYAQCEKAVHEYVQRRPDTAPASDWLIEAE